MLFFRGLFTGTQGIHRLWAGALRLVVTLPRLVASAPRLLASLLGHITGALRLLASTPRLDARALGCSQVHTMFSPALQGVPILNTIACIILLYQWSAITATLKAGRNVLIRSDSVLRLTHPSLHSTATQIRQETSTVEDTFCCCPYYDHLDIYTSQLLKVSLNTLWCYLLCMHSNQHCEPGISSVTGIGSSFYYSRDCSPMGSTIIFFWTALAVSQ